MEDPLCRKAKTPFNLLINTPKKSHQIRMMRPIVLYNHAKSEKNLREPFWRKVKKKSQVKNIFAKILIF